MESNLTILSSNKHIYSIDLYFILYYLNNNFVIIDDFLRFPCYNNAMKPVDYFTYVFNKLPLNKQTIYLLNKLSNVYNKWFNEPSFSNLLYIQHNALYCDKLNGDFKSMCLYKNNIKKINKNAKILQGLHKLTTIMN